MYLEMKTFRVLIGCECSQAITKEFRRLGVEAFSCDTEPAYGGHPEWHYQMDLLELLDENHHWDLAVFHPPCTYRPSVWKVPQCGRKTLDLNILLMRATNPRKAMKCGIYHTRVLGSVIFFL